MGLALPTACWHEPNRLLEALDGRHSMNPTALNGPQSASWERGKGSERPTERNAMAHTCWDENGSPWLGCATAFQLAAFQLGQHSQHLGIDIKAQIPVELFIYGREISRPASHARQSGLAWSGRGNTLP